MNPVLISAAVSGNIKKYPVIRIAGYFGAITERFEKLGGESALMQPE